MIAKDAPTAEVFAFAARVNPDACALRRLLKLASGVTLGVRLCANFVDSTFYLE
jgi:hypothetical protein